MCYFSSSSSTHWVIFPGYIRWLLIPVWCPRTLWCLPPAKDVPRIQYDIERQTLSCHSTSTGHPPYPITRESAPLVSPLYQTLKCDPWRIPVASTYVPAASHCVTVRIRGIRNCWPPSLCSGAESVKLAHRVQQVRHSWHDCHSLIACTTRAGGVVFYVCTHAYITSVTSWNAWDSNN